MQMHKFHFEKGADMIGKLSVGTVSKFTGIAVMKLPFARKRERKTAPAVVKLKPTVVIKFNASVGLTVASVVAMTAEVSGISIDDILGPSRSNRIIAARHVAMQLAVDLCCLSLVNVGKRFWRDHTTIRNAHAKSRDSALYQSVFGAIGNDVTNLDDIVTKIKMFRKHMLKFRDCHSVVGK